MSNMNVFVIISLTITLIIHICNSQCIETYDIEGYYIAVRDTCNPRTWQEAEDYCTEELTSHLATILNWQWNFFAFLAKYGLSNGFYEDAWIGATDQASEGNWVWTEGHEDFDFSEWDEGEGNTTDEDCAYMKAASFRWGDYDCDIELDTWICNSIAVDTCRVDDLVGVYAELGSFTFDQAQQYCENNYGGNLVSITDASEQETAVSARDCISGLPDDRYCWIGLENNEWTDGSDYSYNNFVSNPDTSAGDCTVMLPGESWDYFACYTEFISCFICEDGDPAVDPTPRPTNNPTNRPTNRPTNTPSESPTVPTSPTTPSPSTPTSPTRTGVWWQSWWNGR